jgi:hypothetical protein
VLSAAMVRKECYDKFGLFSLKMPYANDWYLWCVLALHYEVAYVASPMVFVRIHPQSLTNAFQNGGTPVCIMDELNVLWGVAREAEVNGVISRRNTFNSCIAVRAARALKLSSSYNSGLTQAELESLLRRHVNDPHDEQDFRARLHIAIGDEEFWHGQYKKALHAYGDGLSLRPWCLKPWIKYLLLRTGNLGLYIRRLILDLHTSNSELA